MTDTESARAALTALAIFLPLWLVVWRIDRKAQAEADEAARLEDEEAGRHSTTTH